MADLYDREVVRQETTTTADRPEPFLAARTPVTTSRLSVYRARSSSYSTVRAIWWVVGFIDTLVAIRFLLKMFGANAAPFVRFMYDLTWPLVAPFHGIFNTDQVGRSVFEWESLVALAIYALIGWGIVSLIRLISDRGSTTTTTN